MKCAEGRMLEGKLVENKKVLKRGWAFPKDKYELDAQNDHYVIKEKVTFETYSVDGELKCLDCGKIHLDKGLPVCGECYHSIKFIELRGPKKPGIIR